MFDRTLILSTALACALCSTSAAAELTFSKPSFTVTTGDGWSSAEAALLERFSQFGSQSAQAHQRQKGILPTAEAVDTAILLIYGKLPLGSPGDNPNLILAKEKSWSPDFEQTGAGYLKLMQDRVQTLGAPTTFADESKEVTINDAKFHQFDAVNKLGGVDTKQRYLATFVDGYYVYFILSLNDEADADYATMYEVVKSFQAK